MGRIEDFVRTAFPNADLGIPIAEYDLINNFDNVVSGRVYHHFHENLVIKGHLTNGELISYIKDAFEHRKVPTVRYVLKGVRSKQRIINVFYRYYKDESGTNHGKQKEYAALLGDYFQGYNTNNVSTNFSK